jgi:hypothetical protein
VPLDLLKRAEAGAPLTSVQHDANLTAMENAVAAVENGSALADDAVTLAKMAHGTSGLAIVYGPDGAPSAAARGLTTQNITGDTTLSVNNRFCRVTSISANATVTIPLSITGVNGHIVGFNPTGSGFDLLLRREDGSNPGQYLNIVTVAPGQWAELKEVGSGFWVEARRGTISGTVGTTQIVDDAVTLAKEAHGTANRLKGFDGSGVPSEISAGSNVTILNGVLSASVTGGGSQTPWASDIDAAGFSLLNVAEKEGAALTGTTATLGATHVSRRVPCTNAAGCTVTFNTDAAIPIGTMGRLMQAGGVSAPVGYADGTATVQLLAGATTTQFNGDYLLWQKVATGTFHILGGRGAETSALNDIDWGERLPANGTVVLTIGAEAAGTITGLQHRLDAGSCTLALRINGVNVGGLGAVTPTSTRTTTNATSANTFAAGAIIDLVITGADAGLPAGLWLRVILAAA